MTLFNSVISWFIRKRIHQIELFMKYPHEVQEEWFENLLHTASDTEWGLKYDYKSIHTFEEYRKRVPISDYNDLKPFIDRLRQGENNILWPTEVKWFAKSSGTTNDKSKFIPVTSEALEECHMKGGKDLLSIYCNNNPSSLIFSGKILGMGGSFQADNEFAETYHGDVSAIIMENLPFWIQLIRTPDMSVALMDEWEDKLSRMAEITKDEDVTNITGVPSWTLVLLNKILEITGAKNIKEVWPNLEVFVHGGVSFIPYREQFRKICPPEMHYIETYNASEGFFGIQDRLGADDMLLMLDYGIFYEFLPMSEIDKSNPLTIPLWQVQAGVNYAMVISTNAGLWRYLIGDTVVFTSTEPYRIKITGRTKCFINAFGEELIIDNAEKALSTACEKTGASITEYTAAPIFLKDNEKAAHEWVIEFETLPENLDYFGEVLDNALKSANSDYEAKRYHNLMLLLPVIKVVEKGTFYEWFRTRGKLGGQNKVPRLSNERKYVDEILALGGNQS
ncbi:MAG: GH3 auxin-responsive promoter family protein [Bacteroidales bacterium]